MTLETEIEVENTITEQFAFVPCFVNLDHVAYCRPDIGDDDKYTNNTCVTLISGSTITINMKYKEFLEIYVRYKRNK